MMRLLLAVCIAAVAGLWFLGEPNEETTAQQNNKLLAIEKELKDMNDTVSKLQAQSRNAGVKTRQEIDHVIQGLRTRIQTTQKRVQDFRSSPRTTGARDRLRRALLVIRGWLS